MRQGKGQNFDQNLLKIIFGSAGALLDTFPAKNFQKILKIFGRKCVKQGASERLFGEFFFLFLKRVFFSARGGIYGPFSVIGRKRVIITSSGGVNGAF